MNIKIRTWILVFFLIIALLLGNYKKNYFTEIENLQSVVMLEKYSNTYELLGGATGFSVKYDKEKNISYILTNYHVCAIQPKTFLTYIKANDENPDLAIHVDRKIKIAKLRATDDLCLLSVNDYIPPVKFDATFKPMENIYILGAPDLNYPVWVDGKITTLTKRKFLAPYMSEDGDDLLMVSAMIVPGHSGSPIFNSKGRVIGIVFASLDPNSEYGGVGIQTKTIQDFLK